MFKKYIILIICMLCASLSYGCAQYHENGQVSHHISMKTIFEGIKQGKLIINEENGEAQAMLKPEKGQIALHGNFGLVEYNFKTGTHEFEGDWSMSDVRGIHTVNEPGVPEEYRNYCVFSALVDRQTGNIVKVKLAYKGEGARATDVEGYADSPINGSYGHIEKNRFRIGGIGPYWVWSDSHGNERKSEPEGNAGFVVIGAGDLLSASPGKEFDADIFIGVDSIPTKRPVLKKHSYLGVGGGKLKIIE